MTSLGIVYAGGPPALMAGLNIANLSDFTGGDTEDYFFCGLTIDNVPIVRSRTGTGNLYTVNLDSQ